MTTTTDAKDELTLLPCPFWFIRKDAGHNLDIDYEAHLPRVACSCGVRGPVMSGKDDAIAAWNTRTSPASEAEHYWWCTRCNRIVDSNNILSIGSDRPNDRTFINERLYEAGQERKLYHLNCGGEVISKAANPQPASGAVERVARAICEAEGLTPDADKHAYRESPHVKVCKWQYADYGECDVYETVCGEVHQFMDGGINDNNYQYCPYCGGKVEEGK